MRYSWQYFLEHLFDEILPAVYYLFEEILPAASHSNYLFEKILPAASHVNYEVSKRRVYI